MSLFTRKAYINKNKENVCGERIWPGTMKYKWPINQWKMVNSTYNARNPLKIHNQIDKILNYFMVFRVRKIQINTHSIIDIKWVSALF